MKAVLLALLASSVAGGAMAARVGVERRFQFSPTSSEACAQLFAQAVAPDGVRLLKKLDELPRGWLEHAVLRMVGGCPVREIRYEGQTYYVGPATAALEKGPDVGSHMRRYDQSPDKAPGGR